MDDQELRRSAVFSDPVTVTFYLRVPKSHVVLLQTYFELYDGVGTVRTISDPEPTVCVLTTRDLMEDCINVLQAIKTEVRWSPASPPELVHS
jgi:DNA-binding response OmpR family regulator